MALSPDSDCCGCHACPPPPRTRCAASDSLVQQAGQTPRKTVPPSGHTQKAVLGKKAAWGLQRGHGLLHAPGQGSTVTWSRLSISGFVLTVCISMCCDPSSRLISALSSTPSAGFPNPSVTCSHQRDVSTSMGLHHCSFNPGLQQASLRQQWQDVCSMTNKHKQCPSSQ